MSYIKKFFKSVSLRQSNLKFCTVASTKDKHQIPKNQISDIRIRKNTDQKKLRIWKPLTMRLLLSLNSWKHGTIIRAWIVCKNISCYMRGSACQRFILKKAKIFWSYTKHYWFLAGVRNVESWLVFANKLFWIVQPYFSADKIKRS